MGVEVHEYKGEKQEMDYTADLDQNGMRDNRKLMPCSWTLLEGGENHLYIKCYCLGYLNIRLKENKI